MTGPEREPLRVASGGELPEPSGLFDWCLLPAIPTSVAYARAYVRMAITRRGLGDLFDAEVAELIMSELVSNALQHAYHDKPSLRETIHLAFSHDPEGLLLSAGDMSDEPPALKDTSPDEDNGRGLHVIAALASFWGWQPQHGGGKVVYALIEDRNRVA